MIQIKEGSITIAMAAHFAEQWLDDLLKEANTDGRNARRREILFAVTFAETFLFEWVRDHICKSWRDTFKYFPDDDRRSVSERWKGVTKDLKNDNLIKGTPDIGTMFWSDWKVLVTQRNYLVHGHYSKPLYNESGTFNNTLDEMKNGLPKDITFNMISNFLYQSQKPIPPFFEEHYQKKE